MKGYGQFCPIAKAAEIFCERWTALVIRNLGAGAERFNEIHRGVPHMSATLLKKRLRQWRRRGSSSADAAFLASPRPIT
ncbi:winged helix-turn-helix transcriptional regulator [Sulfitobacter sp. D35]|uniref:winged helix-turn-helix transcriptional regulator n=1 Tax=Sulfitobacter sp. D35 TaxID=3083252 RepID=UPI00296F3544|nr:winged helix-turn-helix transcriptional regulator [Sulfitobacter sp. D35]MDW4500604.1 winged helix-turn-helix transcriptional regulator [Sulfitobacter sp. D35]